MLTFDTSTQWLEIPAEVHRESWQPQSLETSGHWQAYLNQVCLKTILPWLQETIGQQPVIHSPETPAFWELVNGSAIELNTLRLIVVPTEAMDTSELRVPQEWVDIPDWVGDYYLAVEIDTDEQMVHVWGYTTHAQIKTQGHYDPIDRTYTVTGKALIQDMAVFWVMQQVTPEPTRVDVPALPSLPAADAEALIQQVRRSDTGWPQLEIPFSQWGALLQDDRWLQRLCQVQPIDQAQQSDQIQQVPQPEVAQRLVQLSQWWQNQFETGWQAIADLFSAEPDLAFSFRREDDSQPSIQRAKQLQLGSGLPDVILAIAVEPEPDERLRIGVQVLPLQGTAYLPANLRLVMQSTAGETLQSVAASDQSNYIQLRRFKCSPGTAFRLLVIVADVSVTEEFVV